MPAEEISGFLLALALFLVCALLPVAVLALLTVPAWIAVRRLLARRFVAPLQRGTLEALLVLGTALSGAASAVLCANALCAAAGAVRGELAQALLTFVVPAPLGLIPCAAGELLGGESETPGLAVSCAIGVTYVLAVGGLALESRGAFVAPGVAMQLGTTALAALGGAAMYLGMRGPAIPPPPPEAVALLRVLSEATPAR